MSPLTALLIVFAMELVSALISTLIGYYASKAYRASSAKGLLFLYLGFSVLGIGIFSRAVSGIYLLLANRVDDVVPSALIGISNTAGIIFMLTQLVAYSLFIATYVYQHREAGETEPGQGGMAAVAAFPVGAMPVTRLFYIPALEVVAIAMLGFVAYSSLINWRHRNTSNAALVSIGFGLMFMSHFFFLFMIFNDNFFFLGQSVQLAGFLCMLLMLIRVNRANAQRT